MKKRPLLISFYSPKGGVGKTSLTIFLASILKYNEGINVMIFDCDYPQHSIFNQREREKKIVSESVYYQTMISKYISVGTKAYPIITCSALNALEVLEETLSSCDEQIDLVLFDLAGSANIDGVVSTLIGMDYIFTPIVADRVTIQSTLDFVVGINDLYITPKIGNLKELYLFWSFVDKRERTPLYDLYNSVFDDLKIKYLKTTITNTLKLRKEIAVEGGLVTRSTILPPNNKLIKDIRFDEFITEIFEILKLNKICPTNQNQR